MPDNNQIIAPKDKSKIPPFVYGKYYLKGFEEGYKEGFEEGYREGFEKGYKESLFIAVKQYFYARPEATDDYVSAIFGVDIAFVHSVRASIQAEQQ